MKKMIKKDSCSEKMYRRMRELTLSGFLNCIDGVYSGDDLVYVMTTNNIEIFDPALTRTGRFDIKLKLDYCTIEQAENIIDFKLKKKISLNKDKFSLKKISPSDIENLCSNPELLQCLS